jgi:hypothetical protein
MIYVERPMTQKSVDLVHSKSTKGTEVYAGVDSTLGLSLYFPKAMLPTKPEKLTITLSYEEDGS